MLKTEQLKSHLKQYQHLAYHRDPELKRLTNQLLIWQQQRMQRMHPNLFQPKKFTNVTSFFFSHLYNFEKLHVLVQQLELALKQKIKLDRWLPSEILDTILIGFELALVSLQQDLRIAQFLRDQKLEVNDENLLSLPAQELASSLRYKQLQQLAILGTKLHKFAHSFVIRSAFKLAKGKIVERGFEPLYLYIDQGFHAMRAHRNNHHFFIQLAKQDQTFLDYLLTSQAPHLQVYYDTQTGKMVAI